MWKLILDPMETASRKGDPAMDLACLNSEAGQDICSPVPSLAGKTPNFRYACIQGKMRVSVNQYYTIQIKTQ